MAKKILSSRDIVDNLEVLQEFVILLNDMLNEDEEPASSMDEVLMQLDTALVNLAIEYAELLELNGKLMGDITTLSMSNVQMTNHMLKGSKALRALADVVDDVILDQAAGLFESEKQLVPPHKDAVKFALQTAIQFYNNEVMNQALVP